MNPPTCYRCGQPMTPRGERALHRFLSHWVLPTSVEIATVIVEFHSRSKKGTWPMRVGWKGGCRFTLKINAGPRHCRSYGLVCSDEQIRFLVGQTVHVRLVWWE